MVMVIWFGGMLLKNTLNSMQIVVVDSAYKSAPVATEISAIATLFFLHYFLFHIYWEPLKRVPLLVLNIISADSTIIMKVLTKQLAQFALS